MYEEVLSVLDSCFKLSEIKEAISQKISYFEIKCTLASLGAQAQKK